MTKIEEAKMKAVAAYKRRNGKCETPFEATLQTASIKIFEQGFDAAVAALKR